MFKDKVLRKIFGRKKEGVKGDWEDFMRRSSMVYIAEKYYASDKIKENEMSGAGGTFGAT